MVGIQGKMCGQYFKILCPKAGSISERELVCERDDGRFGIRGPMYNVNGVFNMLVEWELESNLEWIPRPALRQPPDEPIDIEWEEEAAESGWVVDHPYAGGRGRSSE